MSVGSHKDAFKAHQLVKKIIKKSPSSILGKMAANILLDFVKNQRQVTSESVLDALPNESVEYDSDQLDKALIAVDGLCGKCEDAHDDSCFVNQARRVLIAARTGVDLGSEFDGEKGLNDLLAEAQLKISAIAEDAELTAVTDNKKTDVTGVDLSEAEYSELETLREQDIFRGTLIDEVVSTIQSVTEGNYATEMPIHDDEQLGKLAKAFNLMLSAIKNSMLELDSLVEERTSELKQIMNTVSIGLLSIDEEGRIKPEHSLAAATILGHEVIRGRDFLDLLGITKRFEKEHAEMEQFLDVVRMGMLSDDDLAPLNPFPELELTIADTGRWLRLRYSAVKRNDEPTGEVLVELEDITEEKRLAAEVDASQKENLQLKMIAEDPDVFREFLGEVMKIQQQLHSNLALLAGNSDWLNLINEMFRGVHTIKGAAGSFGLTDLAEVSGELENDLSVARSAKRLEPAFIEGINISLLKLGEKVEEACEIAGTLLGEELSSDGPAIRVTLAELKDMEQMLAVGDRLDALKKRLQELQLIPAHRALGRSVKIIPDLISRLGKKIDFVFEGKEVLLDFQKAHAVNTPLVHLLRNACDHGVESSDQRKNAGKSEHANVTLAVDVTEKNTIVTICDDGKGMNPDIIAQSAINKGVVTKSEVELLSKEEKLKLIFKPGFSTAASVTDISGRGVGLDAVQATIEKELKGEILIDSEANIGTRFTLKIPN